MSKNKLIFNILFLFILNIFMAFTEAKKIVSIPFTLKTQTHDIHYDSKFFFNDYFKREIILHLKTGTPLQRVKAFIEQNSDSFIFRNDKSHDVFYNKRYFPNNSSSFNKISDLVLDNQELKIVSDNFFFKGVEENFILNFLIDDHKNSANNTYVAHIGLNIPNSKDGETYPNLILDLKKKDKINKLIWGLDFDDRYDGNFTIGEDLYDYNLTKYPKSNYSPLKLGSDYSIKFDYIFMEDYSRENNNNENSIKINLKLGKFFFNLNSGIIIGTNQYKDLIDKMFFNELIQQNICKIDILSRHNRNTQSDDEYYLYNCEDKKFIMKNGLRYPINYNFDNFPNLIFGSKELNYEFRFTNKDLFEHIYHRYYFLILFKKDENSNEKNDWYLGEPFYKKYKFSINAENKEIGFYLEKNDNNVENKNIKSNNILKYIIEGIILFSIIFIAYYKGISIHEKRKKRINEVKDENYDYITERSKDINESNNDSNKQKLIELNNKQDV